MTRTAGAQDPAGKQRASRVPGTRPVIRRGPPSQAAVFWRRRLVALLLGLAILALVAWALSGALGSAAPAASAGGPSQSGPGQQGHGGQGGPATAAGGTAGTAGRGGGRAHQGGPAASGKHDPGTSVAGGRTRWCQSGGVVLSLFSSQETYGPGQLPQFNVDVVATSPQTCLFDVGARHVALVIRAGSVRVWNSADCVQGAGTLVSDLQRGVPTVLPISWNRQASSRGCPAPAARMPAGTYSATVLDGSLASNSVTFRMS